MASAIALAIEKTETALRKPNLSIEEVLSLGKQLQELSRLQDGALPKEDIKIEVVYVSPEDGRREKPGSDTDGRGAV